MFFDGLERMTEVPSSQLPQRDRLIASLRGPHIKVRNVSPSQTRMASEAAIGPYSRYNTSPASLSMVCKKGQFPTNQFRCFFKAFSVQQKQVHASKTQKGPRSYDEDESIWFKAMYSRIFLRFETE